MPSVELAGRIEAPAEDIWEVMVGSGKEELLTTLYADKVEMDGDGAGSIVTTTLKAGAGVIKEQILESNPEDMVLRYQLVDSGPLPYGNYRGQIRIIPSGNNACTVTFECHFVPVGIDSEIATKVWREHNSEVLEFLAKRYSGDSSTEGASTPSKAKPINRSGFSADEDAICDLHEGFVTANKTGDHEFLEKHVVPGDILVWYNTNQSNYYGLDHIVELWKTLSKIVGEKGAIAEAFDQEITVSGDMALVTYMCRFAADFGALGSVDDDTRTTEVWQRLEGEWKLTHLHSSNHIPGMMGGN